MTAVTTGNTIEKGAVAPVECEYFAIYCIAKYMRVYFFIEQVLMPKMA